MEQYVCPKRPYLPTKLCGIVTQKKKILILFVIIKLYFIRRHISNAEESIVKSAGDQELLQGIVEQQTNLNIEVHTDVIYVYLMTFIPSVICSILR
jgi:hypothetical protein